jgi:hypothetical protein
LLQNKWFFCYFSRKITAMTQKISTLFLTFLFSTALLLTHSCQRGNSADDRLLSEAAALHEEAMQIDRQLQPQLENLIQEGNSIQIQGRALTPEEMQRVDAINAVRRSYEWFEENHIEVPGHDHDHDHDDHAGHDHGHGPGLELSPADMLAVQQEFLDSIKSIRARVALLLQK